MRSRNRRFDGGYIVVADEDKAVVGLVIETLLKDGHAVFHAYDGLRSTPELEARLPGDVPILREPFTAEELRIAVRPLLPPQLKLSAGGSDT